MALIAEWKSESISGVDNDPISSWADTVAALAVTGTTTTRPVLKTGITPTGKNVARFDGVDDKLTAGGSLPANAKHVFMVAAFRPGSSVDRDTPFSIGLGGFFWAMEASLTFGYALGSYLRDGVSSTAVYPSGQFALYEIVITDASTNGSGVPQFGQYANTGPGAFDVAYVGCYDAEVTGGTLTALRAALTSTYIVPTPPTITTSSPLTSVTEGDTFTGSFAATGGAPGSLTWDNPSGRPTGMTISSGGVRSGTATAAGTFTWTETVTDSIGATGTKSFTLVVTDPLAAFGDLLDLTGLEITPVSLTIERLTCDFGSGYGESASIGTGSGLWGWELSAEVLTDAAAYHDLIATLPSFQYYINFYLDHTEGTAGEIFRIDFRGKQYHASFADESISGTMETYDLFTLSGVKLKMRRMFGVTYNADGSIAAL